MKNIAFIAFLLITLTGAGAQQFDASKIRAGAGLYYATEINNVGLSLNGNYEITNEWEASILYSHFFKKDYVSWNMWDFDAHYIFFKQDEYINVYGIGGLSMIFAKVTIPAISFGGLVISDEQTVKDSNVGVNLGAGANFKVSELINIAPEMRLTFMEDTFLRLGVTVQYMF